MYQLKHFMHMRIMFCQLEINIESETAIPELWKQSAAARRQQTKSLKAFIQKGTFVII